MTKLIYSIHVPVYGCMDGESLTLVAGGECSFVYNYRASRIFELE